MDNQRSSFFVIFLIIHKKLDNQIWHYSRFRSSQGPRQFGFLKWAPQGVFPKQKAVTSILPPASLFIRNQLERAFRERNVGRLDIHSTCLWGLCPYFEDSSYTVVTIAKLGFSSQSRKTSEESTTRMAAKRSLKVTKPFLSYVGGGGIGNFGECVL